MTIVGCDFHPGWQQVAVFYSETGKIEERKSMNGDGDYAVRCFRGYLGDRDQRYRAIQDHVLASPVALP